MEETEYFTLASGARLAETRIYTEHGLLIDTVYTLIPRINLDFIHVDFALDSLRGATEEVMLFDEIFSAADPQEGKLTDE
jgi:hypothetical protein